MPQSQWPVVCGLQNCNNNTTQCGCQLGGGSTWTLSPEYVAGPQNQVSQWTNTVIPSATCAGTTATTSTENTAWLNQSIVDQSTGQTGQGAVPNFAYGSTGMSAYLCRSVVNNSGYNCAQNNNGNSQYCPNNSSPQGQIFYANFGADNLPPHYAVYAVDNCVTAEGVEQGTVPGFYPNSFSNTPTGFDAVVYDMVGNTSVTPNIPAQCIRRH